MQISVIYEMIYGTKQVYIFKKEQME
jgi:hypothetical protein